MKIPENVKKEIDQASMEWHCSHFKLMPDAGLDFEKGAEFGFQKGYALAIERLRGVMTGCFGPNPSPQEWADWLEEQGDV
jgi:hypothetical protein